MKKLAAIGLFVIICGVVALPAIANTRGYHWEMNFRYVNGKDNGQLHNMVGGNLTFAGDIWIYSKDPGHVGPNLITQYVYDTDGTDTLVCTVNYTPYTTIGRHKSFSKACGHIDPDDYYIVVAKADDDGNNERGDGTLDT